MDLFGRFKKLDSTLQRGLDNGFARVFGGEVMPTEVDEVLKQQAEDSVMVNPNGQRLAPCFFTVVVSSRDFDSLISGRPTLQEDLADRLGRFIRNQGWTVNDSVVVRLESHSDLHTGQLRAYSRFEHPQEPTTSADQNDANAGWQSSNSHTDPQVWPEPGSQKRETPESGSSAAQSPADRPRDSYDSAFEDSNPGGEDAAFTGQHQAIDASVAAAAAAGSASSASKASLASLIRPAGESSSHRTDSAQGSQSSHAAQSSPDADSQARNSDISDDAALSWPAPTAQAHGAHPGGAQSDSAQSDSSREDFPARQAPIQQTSANQAPAEEPYEDPYLTSEGVPSYPGTEVIAQSSPDRPVSGADGTSGAAGEESSMSVTLRLRDGSNRNYVLKSGTNAIGRGNGVDLRISDSGVSRTHAEIAWDGFDAVLTDLQSTNGTSVNDIAIENWLLADGDIIIVGHTEIEVAFNSKV